MAFIKEEPTKPEYVYFTLFYIVFKIGENLENYIFFEKLESIPESDNLRDKAKKVKIKFALPNFSMNNFLSKESIAYTPDGRAYHNISMYKENVLKHLLKRIETDNLKLDINSENYANLNYQLAESCFDIFNKYYLNPNISIEELKNIIVS